MERNTPTPLLSVIPLLVVSSFSAHPAGRMAAIPIPVQLSEPPVTLTLECVDPSNIRLEIRNAGTADTSLPLGQALANGRKYLISELNLRMKPANGSGTDYHYWPRGYPVAIGGRLDPWFEALPVGATYRMPAKAEDFFAVGRQPSFPSGIELSLRWTMSVARPKSLFPLVYWTGTLISNSCMVP